MKPLHAGPQEDLAQRPDRAVAEVATGGHGQVEIVAADLPGLGRGPGRVAPQHGPGPVAVAGHRGAADDHRADRARRDGPAERGGREGPDQPSGAAVQDHLVPGARAPGPPPRHVNPDGDHTRPGPDRHDPRASPEARPGNWPRRRARAGPVGEYRACRCRSRRPARPSPRTRRPRQAWCRPARPAPARRRAAAGPIAPGPRTGTPGWCRAGPRGRAGHDRQRDEDRDERAAPQADEPPTAQQHQRLAAQPHHRAGRHVNISHRASKVFPGCRLEKSNTEGREIMADRAPLPYDFLPPVPDVHGA